MSEDRERSASGPSEPTSTVSEDRERSASGPSEPFLRVVRGHPTREEIAALVTVLSARVRAAASARSASRAPRPRSAWRDPARLLRRETRRGPGAWRRSGWPA